MLCLNMDTYLFPMFYKVFFINEKRFCSLKANLG